MNLDEAGEIFSAPEKVKIRKFQKQLKNILKINKLSRNMI